MANLAELESKIMDKPAWVRGLVGFIAGFLVIFVEAVVILALYNPEHVDWHIGLHGGNLAKAFVDVTRMYALANGLLCAGLFVYAADRKWRKPVLCLAWAYFTAMMIALLTPFGGIFWGIGFVIMIGIFLFPITLTLLIGIPIFTYFRQRGKIRKGAPFDAMTPGNAALLAIGLELLFLLIVIVTIFSAGYLDYDFTVSFT